VVKLEGHCRAASIDAFRITKHSCASSLKRDTDAKASHRISNADRKKSKSREVTMNDLAGCRYMERLYRQRAVFDHAQSWKWLGEAERWKDHAHLEIGGRFREKPVHPYNAQEYFESIAINLTP
jgi:hypothetical protein